MGLLDPSKVHTRNVSVRNNGNSLKGAGEGEYIEGYMVVNSMLSVQHVWNADLDMRSLEVSSSTHLIK